MLYLLPLTPIPPDMKTITLTFFQNYIPSPLEYLNNRFGDPETRVRRIWKESSGVAVSLRFRACGEAPLPHPLAVGRESYLPLVSFPYN